MAKFKLSTDKLLLVRGGLVSLKAGEVDTDDKELIAALSGALDVEQVDEKPESKKQEPAS